MNLMRTVAESPLVHRLGYGLVHFLWEGVLIAAALGLALLLLRVRRVLGLPEERRRGATAGALGGVAALTVVTALIGFAALAGPAPPPVSIDPATQADGKTVAREKQHDGEAHPRLPASWRSSRRTARGTSTRRRRSASASIGRWTRTAPPSPGIAASASAIGFGDDCATTNGREPSPCLCT